VTLPLDELRGRIYAWRPGISASTVLVAMSARVGSIEPGRVLLTVGLGDGLPLAEIELSPADAIELARRLLRMAARVHHYSTPDP
jgi:hypothetical protein